MKQKINWFLQAFVCLASTFSLQAQNIFPATGNVGIGTISPLALLEVKNDILVQGIRVGTGGPTGASPLFGSTCLGERALNGAFGSNNTALGYYTLYTLGAGQNNTAVGNSALYSTGGSAEGNTVTGSYAMEYSTGSYNAAYGIRALNVSSGSNNCGFGSNALARSSGSDNVAIGTQSMVAYTEFDPTSNGSRNTAVGTKSLLKFTSCTENTAIGYSALLNTTTGSQNAALGNFSMGSNTTGSYNTALGRYSLYLNTTGADNTGVGDLALYYNVTGANNSALGYFASPNASALTNTTSLGYNTRATASNQVRIGNSTVSSIGGYVNWTNISDARVKKNIKENVPGLAFINQLVPVTYNLSLAEADKIINKGIAPEKLIQRSTTDDKLAIETKEKIVYTGFLAQDVEKAAHSINYDFSGIEVPSNSNSLYGLRYSEFVMPLVKAVQELSVENEKLKKDIEEIKALLKNKNTTNTISSAWLEQNIPNPNSNNTTVNYSLPVQYTNAKIIVTNNAGKALKTLDVSGSGKGSIILKTNELNAGTYQYSLYANGTLIDTKRMVVIR